MEVALPFITQRKGKKSKPQKRTIAKIRNSYTPVEIMNMDIQELEYLYEHGSPTEQDIADNILRARKKWMVASSMSDDADRTDSPNSGAPTSYIVGMRGEQ